MADRLDVSEELVRLETHLAHAGELAAAPGAVGRKLDFVIQEIGRELNTIGSKSQDAGVAGLVIDAQSRAGTHAGTGAEHRVSGPLSTSPAARRGFIDLERNPELTRMVEFARW